MKKATIVDCEMGDRLAKFYDNKGQGGTIFEVVVNTRAAVNERVKLIELEAERRVLVSRWVQSLRVVHFTADDWLYMRGLKCATEAQLFAASGRNDDEPTARPASHAKP